MVNFYIFLIWYSVHTHVKRVNGHVKLIVCVLSNEIKFLCELLGGVVQIDGDNEPIVLIVPSLSAVTCEF